MIQTPRLGNLQKKISLLLLILPKIFEKNEWVKGSRNKDEKMSFKNKENKNKFLIKKGGYFYTWVKQTYRVKFRHKADFSFITLFSKEYVLQWTISISDETATNWSWSCLTCKWPQLTSKLSFRQIYTPIAKRMSSFDKVRP